MGLFILRRLGVMILTALCLTFIVFWLTNLAPNLEKLAKTQGNARMSDEAVQTWLANRGYAQPLPTKYGQWLGIMPGYVIEGTDGEWRGRCVDPGQPVVEAPRFCGILQGDWGFSTVAKEDVGEVLPTRLANTGKLMFWVMVVMVPGALIVGVLAGASGSGGGGSRSRRSRLAAREGCGLVWWPVTLRWRAGSGARDTWVGVRGAVSMLDRTYREER